MDHESGLLQIGVFSRLTSTSVRMLRYYQQHGLLEPALVDPGTGYRFYRAAQLQTVRRIEGLRDAGFTVSAMITALEVFDDPALLSVHLQGQRDELLRQQAEAEVRLVALDRLIHTTEEPTMTFDVTTTTLPAMTVAYLRDVIPTYADEGALWQRLMPALVADGIPLTGRCGATFHDTDYRESDVDVEVWQEVLPGVSRPASAACRTLPAQQVVTTTLRGSYELMPRAMEALGRHVADHALQVGPMFNIYRLGPAEDPDPANWVTDVYFPVIGD